MVQLGTSSEDESFDSARLRLFSGFGFYYGHNYYVYRAIEKFPWGGTWRAAVGMSVFDIFIHLPFSFYPQFYLFRRVFDPRPSSLSEFLERCPSFCGSVQKPTRQLPRSEDTDHSFHPRRLAMRCLCPVAPGSFLPHSSCSLSIISWHSVFVPLHLRVPFLSVGGMIFPMGSRLRGVENPMRMNDEEVLSVYCVPRALSSSACTDARMIVYTVLLYVRFDYPSL